MFAVEINDVHKSFDEGETFVLKGMNLKIPKDKITVIIGFSGTGKSVLLKHMLGLHMPTSGEVRVLDKNIWEMSSDQLIQMRCKLGVLFQHAALFDDLTVMENVMFPLIEHKKSLTYKQKKDIAIKKLEMSGMGSEHFKKLPSELSGGMRKRVGLARALALDPEILLYDEPTTGLDPILTEMVDNLILDTHKSHEGTTSVVVTHDLMAGFRIGEYIVMLDKGKVLLSGTAEDFYNSEIELVQRFLSKGLKKQ